MQTNFLYYFMILFNICVLSNFVEKKKCLTFENTTRRYIYLPGGRDELMYLSIFFLVCERSEECICFSLISLVFFFFFVNFSLNFCSDRKTTRELIGCIMDLVSALGMSFFDYLCSFLQRENENIYVITKTYLHN